MNIANVHYLCFDQMLIIDVKTKANQKGKQSAPL